MKKLFLGLIVGFLGGVIGTLLAQLWGFVATAMYVENKYPELFEEWKTSFVNFVSEVTRGVIWGESKFGKDPMQPTQRIPYHRPSVVTDYTKPAN